MSARLTPLNSNIVGPLMLQRPVILIGRHPECDVRIDLPAISRRHCCIALAYERITLRDLGSRNGVRVNGRIVEEAVLHPGDELAIGQILFRVDGPTPPPAPPPVPPPPPPPPAASPPVPPADLFGLPSLPDDDELIPIDF